MKRINRFVVFYLIRFAIVCALALLASSQAIAILFMVATFGAGIVLLPIPINLAAWMAMNIPFVLSFQVGRPWAVAIGAIATLSLIGVILVVPVVKARAELDEEIASLSRNDVVRTLRSTSAEGIEIRFSDIGSEIPSCDEVCSGLLVGGKAKWVRVVISNDWSGEVSEQTFIAGSGKFCAPLERCPVVSSRLHGSADILIEKNRLTHASFKAQNQRLDSRLAQLDSVYRLKILDTRANETLFQETSIARSVATTPIYWVPEFNELRLTGFVVSKRKIKQRPISMVSALRAIGIMITPQVAPRRIESKSYTKLPTSAETSTVVALLDRQKDQPFETVDQNVIRDYIRKARWYPDNELPELHRDIAVRIFQERRFEGPSDLDQLLRDDSELRARVLPWMMEAFEAGEEIPKWTMQDLQVALVYSYSPDELAPYYERYRRILEALPADAYSIWYYPVGRFGGDPMPLLKTSARTGKERLEISLAAFCHTAPEWESSLADVLWEDVRSYVQTSAQRTMLSWPVKDALKALTWAGFRPKLDHWITSLGLSAETTERLVKILDRVNEQTPKHIAC